MFWKQYLDMVEVQLLFIRADSEGDWSLHLPTFKEMMPLMMAYDHTNYSRWGLVYLIDMLQLEQTTPAMYEEFCARNFVIKESAGAFNQIATDLALEHINKQCKVAGGLVGISRTKSALDHWVITFSDRAQLSNDIKQMAGARPGSKSLGDSSSKRMMRDGNDVQKLEEQIKRLNPFNHEEKNWSAYLQMTWPAMTSEKTC